MAKKIPDERPANLLFWYGDGHCGYPGEQKKADTEVSMTSVSQTLAEHLADIAYQLTRIADQLERITGTTSYGDGKGYVRVANID